MKAGRWTGLLWAVLVCGFLLVTGREARAQATGALSGGWSAATVASGGAAVAETGETLDAVETNPAGLAGLARPVLELSGVGAWASGSFQNTVDRHGVLGGNAGAIPYGAFGFAPTKLGPWRAALAVTPESLMRAEWRYADPPGTAGASYGLQKNESKIVAVRSSATLARSLGSRWAVGGSLGLVYNTNLLDAPFIFQQQPQLAGLKVLLNLQTRGWGWNGSAGAQWQPSENVRLGASWKSATAVQSHGDASGTASAQFAALGIGADPEFHYRAEVDNRFPQSVAAGGAWQPNSRLRLRLEGDWTGWGGAFRELPVKLSAGTNSTINAVAGSNAIRDAVPLGWRNQEGVRFGLETPAGERWTVRGGYSFQTDPVPASTLTPLTAAVMRQALAGGTGWRRGRWALDAAYQAQLPESRSVGQSGLLAGEYSNTHLRVQTQSATITTRIAF